MLELQCPGITACIDLAANFSAPSTCTGSGSVDALKGPFGSCFVQYQCCDWWNFALREWKCQQPAIESCDFGSGPPQCQPAPYVATCGTNINACLNKAVCLTAPQTVPVPAIRAPILVRLSGRGTRSLPAGRQDYLLHPAGNLSDVQLVIFWGLPAGRPTGKLFGFKKNSNFLLLRT